MKNLLRKIATADQADIDSGLLDTVSNCESFSSHSCCTVDPAFNK